MTKVLEFPLINGIPVYPIYGATQPVQQAGYLSSGDLITETADGTDLNELWDEVAASTAIYNEAMDRLISVLTFPVTVPVETVPQVGEISFEEATEYGVPQAAQLPLRCSKWDTICGITTSEMHIRGCSSQMQTLARFRQFTMKFSAQTSGFYSRKSWKPFSTIASVGPISEIVLQCLPTLQWGQRRRLCSSVIQGEHVRSFPQPLHHFR
jgi:hypothetical protein